MALSHPRSRRVIWLWTRRRWIDERVQGAARRGRDRAAGRALVPSARDPPPRPGTDGALTIAAALAALKAEGRCPTGTEHRQARCLNNVVEAGHGKLKQLVRPVRGFETLKTAHATIKGFEVMRALRKGQRALFNLTGDARDEARFIERAFGLGACALTKAVQLIDEQFGAA